MSMSRCSDRPASSQLDPRRRPTNMPSSGFGSPAPRARHARSGSRKGKGGQAPTATCSSADPHQLLLAGGLRGRWPSGAASRPTEVALLGAQAIAVEHEGAMVVDRQAVDIERRRRRSAPSRACPRRAGLTGPSSPNMAPIIDQPALARPAVHVRPAGRLENVVVIGSAPGGVAPGDAEAVTVRLPLHRAGRPRPGAQRPRSSHPGSRRAAADGAAASTRQQQAERCRRATRAPNAVAAWRSPVRLAAAVAAGPGLRLGIDPTGGSFQSAARAARARGGRMLIGVPKEIKAHEYRVGLTPASVRELVQHGHEVLVETGAGARHRLRRRGLPRRRRQDRRQRRGGLRRRRDDREGEGAAARRDRACCARTRSLFTYLHLARRPAADRGADAARARSASPTRR